MTNQLTLSDDRKVLTITDGRTTATLHSARPEGFIADDLLRAETMPLNTSMVEGQVNTARRIKAFGRTWYVAVNTGPPTWWLPKVRITHREVMVGWLRGLVALSWRTP
jgi:hypothetical protein